MQRGLQRWLQKKRHRCRRSYGTASFNSIHDSGSSCCSELGCSFDAIASVLQHCAKFKTLSVGRSCHDCICRLAFDTHPYIHSLLVQMYASAYALDDALSVFTATHHLHRQSFIWNHIIDGLVHHQQHAYALQIFERMPQQSVLPDNFTFTSVLTGFTNKEYICKGKNLHAITVICGLHQNVVLATAMMTMYQKCGLLEAAWGTFMNVFQPDEVCWTSIIAAYTQHCQSEQALHLFNLMLLEGFPPSKFAIACTLDACANGGLITEGKSLHSCIVEYDFKIDTVLGNGLIKLYSTYELLDDARHVYDCMQPRDVVSSNSLIHAYAQHGQANKAFQVFYQLFGEGTMPNKITYSSVIDACGIALAEEAEGRKIHGFVVEAGFDGLMMLETKLLKMYAKYGRLEDAQRVFEKMQEHNTVSYTTMVSVLAQQGKCAEALFLFNQMQQEGIRPNSATCLCMLDACASLLALMKVKYGHVLVLNYPFESYIAICNILVSIYGKCGSIEDACKVFESMSQRDLVSWTAMIGVYAQHYHGEEAVQLFCKMLREVGANKVTYVCVMDACASSFMLLEGRLIHFCIIHDGLETDDEIMNALVNMHGKCGSLEDALHIFIFSSAHDVISWTALIGAYAHHQHSGEALGHFENMLQEGVMPNKVTFISVLDCFVDEKFLLSGKRMHCCIIECGFMSDVPVGNAVIKMYGRCHSLEAACTVFECMGKQNLVSWTAIIAVHAQHLKGQEALELFNRMKQAGLEPNSVTFVCILDACASYLALATGEHIHSLIVQKNLESNVFIGTALVKMYGKCGQLHSARRVFDRLTKHNLLTWTAIIAIYAHHGEGEEAVKLFEAMEHEGFRADDVSLVSILVACSHSGLVDEGSLLFTKMMNKGNISPNVDHYACMIDLLGRAGRVNEAEVLVCDMPCEPTTAALMSLFGSCRKKEEAYKDASVPHCDWLN